MAILATSIAIPETVYAADGKKHQGNNREHHEDNWDHYETGPIKWGWKHNQQWVHRFYGKPSFRLREDRKLRRSVERAKTEKRMLDRLVERLRPLQRTLRQKQNNKNRLDHNIQTIAGKITKLKQRIRQAKIDVPHLTQQLAQLDKKLSAQLRQKDSTQQQLNSVKAQAQALTLKIAGVEVQIRVAVQKCMDGGKSKQQCESAPQVMALKRELSRLQQRKRGYTLKENELTRSLQQLQWKITQTRKRKQTTRRKLTQAQDTLTNGQSELVRKQAVKDEYQRQLSQLTAQIQHLQNRLFPLIAEAKAQKLRLRQAKRDAKSIRRQLITEVLLSNEKGHRYGGQQGSRKGFALATRLGTQKGTVDGEGDGRSQGIRAGQEREYKSGHGEGQVIGEKKANEEGERDGKILGRDQGNTSAGHRLGKLDGIHSAKNSDASAVGQKTGSQRRHGKGRGRWQAQGRGRRGKECR